MINHLAFRYKDATLCGRDSTKVNSYWADAIKVVKANPDYKGIKFCSSCMKIFKTKRIKQLTAEECKKA